MSNDSFNRELADFLEDDDQVYAEMAAIEERCEEYIQLYRLGKAPSYAEFAAGFPDVKDQILDLLPTVVAIEDARKKNLVKRNDGRIARGPEAVPRLGDYEIIREIGRGGMGIVYEANQSSLDRRVAIKVLPKFSLTSSQVEKFHEEARTAAKLHHSNIAPVYDVGEQNGLHFYVMQLLNGDSLDAYVPFFESEETLPLLEELSMDEVVQVGLQVSSALQYAHTHNVLHRDIKPANLILDPDYNVWVTDFGLARTESNITANQPPTYAYTATSKVVGTLRYIAPEIIDGQAGDVRSDVYSLGVTLIELLSGRPAFEPTSEADVIKQVRAGSFNISDRESKRLPRDLHAILEKSVATNPADRYLSAMEMNHDLRNFVDGLPVNAVGRKSFVSAWKWIKRNPEMTLASVIAGGLMLATLFVLTVSFLRIESVLDSEKNQRVKAENNSKLAAQAMDRMFGQFSNSLTKAQRKLVDFSDDENNLVADLPQPQVAAPKLAKETVKLLEELSGFYVQLAAQNNHDSDLKVKAMKARTRVGEIHERIGQYDRAITSFRIALDGYFKLIDRNLIEESNNEALMIARLYNHIGFSMKMNGEIETAGRQHAKAIERLQKMLSSEKQVDSQLELEMARSLFLTAYRSRPGMEPTSLPSVEFSRFASNTKSTLDSQYREVDQDQRECLLRAIEILNPTNSFDGEVVENDPKREHLLASCYRELANDNWSRRSSMDQRFHEKSVSIFESLAERFPDQPTFQFELMRTLAEINVFEGKISAEVLEQALTSLQQSVEIGNRLIRAEPDVSVYRVELIHANFKLAQICRKLIERPDKAVADSTADDERQKLKIMEESGLRQSLNEQDFLSRQYPDSIAYKVWISRFALSLARCEVVSQREKNRNQLIARAITVLNRLPDEDFRKPEVTAIMAEAEKMSYGLLMNFENGSTP